MPTNFAQLDQLERLLTFNNVALRIQDEPNVDNIYRLIGEGLKEIGLNCAIMFLDKEQKHVQLKYASIFPSLVSKAEKILGVKLDTMKIPIEGDMPITLAIRERRAVYQTKAGEMLKGMVPSLHHTLLLGQAAKIVGLNHAIAAPLIARGKVFGALAVWSRNIPEEDVPIVVAFANQAAMAMDNAAWLPLEFWEKAVKIKEAEEKFKRLLDDMNDGYLVFQDGKIVFANRRFASIFGYTIEEVLGQTFTRFISPDAGMVKIEQFVRMIRGEEKVPDELEAMKADGTKITVDLNLTTIEYEGKPAFSVIMRDITDRKQAEDALRDSEQHHKILIETASRLGEGIMIFQNFENGIGTVAFANDAMVKILGYSKKELLTKNLHNLASPTILIDIKRKYKHWQSGSKIEEFFETLLLAKDGTEVPVEIGASTTIYQGRPAIIAFIRDITERKRAEEQLRNYSENLERMVEERTRELKDAQDKVFRTEKLAAIGELAGNMAHELRNPLGAVKASAHFLKMVLGDTTNEKFTKHLNILEKQSDLCNSIITDLLDFSQPSRLKIMSIDIDQLVKEVLQNATIPQNIDISTSLVRDPAKVKADRGHLERIFSNLIANSIEAMPNGGKLFLSTNQNEHFIEVRVADTGTGIDEENLYKVFEPLYTTKAQGVGLGLSLSKALVERQKGTIDIQSQTGEGTTITINLPITVDE